MLPHIDDFLQNLRVKDYSVSTVHNYEQYLAVFARFLDETNIPFDKISRQSIASYKTYLAGGRSGAMPSTEVAAKLSPCTVNYKLAGLRTYLRYLIDIDYPCPLAPEIVKNLKSLPKRPQLPRFEDLIKLIEMPRHDANIVERRDKAILEILFNTGLKVSELVGLNRERVDLQRKRLHLKGKGQETRTVFLPDNTVHWIAHYLRSRRDHYHPLFIRYSGRVDAQKGGEGMRLTARSIQNIVGTYARRCGLPMAATPETLRHCFATYVARQDANPVPVHVLLGHESSIVARYVHASDEYVEETHHRRHPWPNRNERECSQHYVNYK